MIEPMSLSQLDRAARLKVELENAQALMDAVKRTHGTPVELNDAADNPIVSIPETVGRQALVWIREGASEKIYRCKRDLVQMGFEIPGFRLRKPDAGDEL